MILCDLQPVFSYVLIACVQIIGLYLRLAGSSLALAFCFLRQVSVLPPRLRNKSIGNEITHSIHFSPSSK